MELARKIWTNEVEVKAERPRPAREPGLEGLEKVLRFAAPRKDGEGERSASLSAHDITYAIDLVHDAAKSIKAAEERVREGDARTQAIAQRATEELKSAEARVQAAEARARAAEARIQEAEARAHEAENWLRQIFSTISDELPARG